MSAQNTISESKEIFHKEFPYVIPPIYRRLADELLVELHLTTHRESFKLSNLYALGITTTFNEFTKGYRPESHLNQLFKAICLSNGLLPDQIQEKAKEISEISKQFNCDEFNNMFKDIEGNNDKIKENINKFNIENIYYNRITAIGIFKFYEIIKERISKSKVLKDFSPENIGFLLGLPKDKIEKDIRNYQGNIKKMKLALELISTKNS